MTSFYTSLYNFAYSAFVIHSSKSWKSQVLNLHTSEKRFFHHLKTIKGSIAKQSGTDVECFQFLWWFFLCLQVIMKMNVKYSMLS